MNLSKPQQEAVTYMDSPVLVTAGAGSGKTRTLTAKIAHLIATGMDSRRILAITFTNKAAEEMKSRLTAQTGLSISRFPWVRTFHSACFKIFKEHCQILGFAPPVQVYATYQQQKTLKDILVARLNLDKKFVPIVASEISHAKNSGNPEPWLAEKGKAGHFLLTDIYGLYEKELLARNAVDFDNILFLTRNLLRDHAEIRSYYQGLFDYILCDEYQDTNNLQEDLTGLLVKNGRLFCVGDDWQAIYSFRGSNVDHFLNFMQKYPDGRIFKLEQNYRSANEIVDIANHLIKHNRDRMKKKCFSSQKGGAVEIHDFMNEREEAAWVVSKIGSLHRKGIDYSQMAVLYRTKFCSLAFEQALRSSGAPYQMLGGKGFFERKEIMDINCYLSAAVFPKDDTSFERILNVPKRGMGPGAIKKIAVLQSETVSLQEAARLALSQKIMAPKVYSALDGLLNVLDQIRNMKPDEAVRHILDSVGYMAYLEDFTKAGSMDFTQRRENIDQLIYSTSQKDSIVDYLEEAALVREDTGDDEDDVKKGVSLSTVHAAKGLEFHAVFVTGCEENLFPHWKSTESPSGIHEERRLMYVAMTRAEKYLYMTSADFRKGQYNARSRFLSEIEAAMR
ncbi:MAG: UvrD-helicase domain-containing protein [Desulfatirhabdiaceae bacterium]